MVSMPTVSMGTMGNMSGLPTVTATASKDNRPRLSLSEYFRKISDMRKRSGYLSTFSRGYVTRPGQLTSVGSKSLSLISELAKSNS